MRTVLTAVAAVKKGRGGCSKEEIETAAMKQCVGINPLLSSS